MEPKPWALIGPMAKFRSFMTSPSTAATVSFIIGEKFITEVVLDEIGKHIVQMAHLGDGETIMVPVIVAIDNQTLQIDSQGLGNSLHVDMSIGIYMKPNKKMFLRNKQDANSYNLATDFAVATFSGNRGDLEAKWSVFNFRHPQHGCKVFFSMGHIRDSLQLKISDVKNARYISYQLGLVDEVCGRDA